MPYTFCMFTFVETILFTKRVREYLSDEEYGELQKTLIHDPEPGAVIRGSGGVRKIRWAVQGRGKRGGIRVIYFVRHSKETIWMLTLYPKSVMDTIPGRVLKQIREEIEND